MNAKLDPTFLLAALAALVACGGEAAGPTSAAAAAPAPTGFVPPVVAANAASTPNRFRDAPPSPSAGCEPATAGKTYDVGADQPIKTLGRVPWARLLPGDAVRIHWRPDAYREKLLLSASGTAKHPIRVCGLPGPKGELPAIDGDNATTDASADFTNPEQGRRGLVILGLRRDQEYGEKAKYIVIEGLELRNAAPPFAFKNAAGENRVFTENAACVFVERGEHIVMRKNVVHGCGNGLFVASADSEQMVSRDILIDGNYLYGNGTPNKNTKQHAVYTEAIGMVLERNRFGPNIEGSLGNHFKDRSVGTVVRYNWFEGGSRAIDLVEPEESFPMVGKLPELHSTYVYGNVIVFGGRTSSRPIHYGGDNGTEERYRKGTLFFYDNTIVFTTNAAEQPKVALIQLQTDEESADIRNNIVVSSGTTHFSWIYEHGTARLGVNWASKSIAPLAYPPGKGITGKVEMLPGGKTITGDAPGFAAAGDFCLSASSPAHGAAAELSASLPPAMLPTLEYVKHQETKPRGATRDLGAFACEVKR